MQSMHVCEEINALHADDAEDQSKLSSADKLHSIYIMDFFLPNFTVEKNSQVGQEGQEKMHCCSWHGTAAGISNDKIDVFGNS